jgi:glyoxylase-like metal-dependent hydrolase (beta-lactamase superfamily II)
MKRILIAIGLVVLLVIAGIGAAIAAAFMGRRGVTDGQEINGIRLVADGIGTVAVVPAGTDTVALIDAGNDSDGTALLAELSRRGLGPEAVVAILLTHGHADHIGAVLKFPAARVMALEREVGLVEGHEGALGPLLRLMPVRQTGIRVTQALHDGETVTVGDVAVRAFGLPGHTAGSAAYLIRGVLFVGDSADTSSSGALQGAPWIFSDNQAQNRASLAALAERLAREGQEITAIVPAHSAALIEGRAPLDTFARTNRE